LIHFGITDGNFMGLMMRKNCDIILTIIFLSALVFLSACGPKETVTPTLSLFPSQTDETSAVVPSPVPEMFPTQQNIAEDLYAAVDPSGQAITFWHSYDGNAEQALLSIIADFNASNPWNITVQAEFQGSYQDSSDKMLAFMNTAEIPNLLTAYPHQAATYQLNKALINLDELVYSKQWGLTLEEIADIFPGYFQKDVFSTFDRQRLGLPVSGSMQMLYYNRNWLAELGYSAPPASPDEFREMACAAARQPFSGATAEGSSGYQLRVDATDLTNWIFAFGGFVFDDTVGQYDYDNPAAVNALQFVKSLTQEGCLSLVGEERADRQAFSQGTSLFSVDAANSIPEYDVAVAENAQFDWSVAPLPHVAAPLQNVSGPSLSITRSTPEQQLAAWLFVKYWLDPGVQSRWAQASGDFPVRASAAADLRSYFSANPAYAAAFEWLPFGAAEPAAPGYEQVRDLATEALFAITQGADVPGVLAGLTTDANASLTAQMAAIPQSSDPWVNVDPNGQTIIFWHQQAPARHALLDEIIWEFNSTNEWGITVVPEYQGNADELFDKTRASLSNGTPPGLVEAYQDQAASYDQTAGLRELTGLVNSVRWGLSPREQADFFPGVFTQDIFPNLDRARLGFPLQRSLMVLYYNAEWLAELRAAGAIDFDGPPLTPEQFQAAACAAVKSPFSKADASGSQGYELNVDAATFTAWVFALGGQVYDSQQAEYTYDHPSAVAAASFLENLIDRGCARKVRERYGDQSNFAEGSTLFTIGSSAGLSFYQEAVTEGAAFEWGLVAVPYTTPEPELDLSGVSLSIPASTPEAELAAWLFIKYFTGPEIQARWAQASGYLPVRAAAASGLSEYLAANPAYASAWELLPFGTAEPSTPGYDSVRKMVAEALTVILDGERIPPILDQLNQDANLNLLEQLTR
jgi:multiple sugar transport system substrate-binding protein